MVYLGWLKEKLKVYAKVCVFLPCGIWTVSACYAQTDYYIVNIKGKIVSQKTGKQLQRGDKINEDEGIKFGSEEAVAITIGTKKGRFVLKSKKGSTRSNSEFFHMVKTVLMPMPTIAPLNSRGSDRVLNKEKVSLQEFLGRASFVFIDVETPLPFDTNEYALPKKWRILWQSIPKEGEKIYSELEIRGKEIIVNRDKVASTNDSSMVSIFAEDLLSTRKTNLAEFVPVFIDREELKKELLIQKKVLESAGLSQIEIKQDLENYVSQVYGKMEYSAFQSLFDQLQN